MNRYIKSFSSLTDTDKLLIRNQYPKGFSGKDLVTLKTAKGNSLDVLEIHAEDAIYLVKVNHELMDHIDEMARTEEYAPD